MKKHSKWQVVVALALTLLLVLSVFSGCGKRENEDQGGKADYNGKPVTLNKVGAFDAFINYIAKGGIITKVDNKNEYGVISFDGKHDTGSTYVNVEECKRFFEATYQNPEDENDIDGINQVSLIDGAGKEVVPGKHAYIKGLSDRFVQVIDVTERTDSKKDYILYMPSTRFSLSPADGDPLYKGSWKVYDVTTGEPVPGVSGTNGYTISVYNNTIEYVTDDEQKVYVNENGTRLPENEKVLNNGDYRLASGNDGVVYDSSGKEVFKYAPDEFVPIEASEDYYIGEKRADGTSTYVVLDKTGKVVSAEFDTQPKIVNGYVSLDKYLCDFDGKKIWNDQFTFSYHDSIRGLGMILGNDDREIFYDADGNEVFSCKITDDLKINTSTYTIEKKTSEGSDYYCWKDKDFTIKNAYSVGEGFVSIEKENGTRALVDTLTGEELLSSYKQYRVGGNVTEGLFVYAQNADNTYDVYKAS